MLIYASSERKFMKKNPKESCLNLRRYVVRHLVCNLYEREISNKKDDNEQLQNIRKNLNTIERIKARNYSHTFVYQCKRCQVSCSNQPEICRCYANSLKYLELDVQFAP